MSEMKKQSTIKDMILATIEGHIDAQNAKGMKKYGETIDDCPVDDYSWPNMVIEELIDALQYQQKEIGRLMQRETSKLSDSRASDTEQEQSPSEEKGTRITPPVDDKREVIRKMENRIDQLLTELEEVRMAVKGKEGVIDSLKRAITMREEIMEDQSDEIEGLKAEIGELKTQPNTLQLKNDILTNLMKLYLQEVEG